MSDLDRFARVYDVWVSKAPITDLNAPFYVQEYLDSNEPVVELGVGNGRILLEAARQGRNMVGVDISPGMLELCRERAAAQHIEDRVSLLQGDFRDFQLDRPARLISIPFHSLGHLTTEEDQRSAICRVHQQLAPGGRFVLDHFVFDPELAGRYDRKPRLHAEFRDPETGRDTILWYSSAYDFQRQVIRVVIWTDELDDDGRLVDRHYFRIELAWIHPETMRSMLLDAGFRIESVFGSFDRTPFDETSGMQIWVAEKPTSP